MTKVESGKFNFSEFCHLSATFLVENPDMETMQEKPKDFFRLFDKEALGFNLTEILS